MIQQQASSITEAINALATQLRVPVTYLWSALLRDAYVYGAQCMVAFAVFSAVAAQWWSRYARAEFARQKRDYNDDKVMAWVGTVVIAFGLAIAFVFLLDGLGDMANPAGYALGRALAALR